MAQYAIYQYGNRILSIYKPIRFIYQLSDLRIEHIVEVILKYKQIDLSHYTYNKIERTSVEGFNLHWHVDDTVIVKIKKDSMIESSDTILNEKYKLSNRTRNATRPVFSIVVYLSEHGIDFTGGEFHFIDEIILPKKQMMIFFDSHEVHRVQKVTSGLRNAILYKFYKYF
jgi:hypothetical protein